MNDIKYYNVDKKIKNNLDSKFFFTNNRMYF